MHSIAPPNFVSVLETAKLRDRLQRNSRVSIFILTYGGGSHIVQPFARLFVRRGVPLPSWPPLVFFIAAVRALLARKLDPSARHACQKNPGSQAHDLRIQEYHSVRAPVQYTGTNCTVHVHDSA